MSDTKFTANIFLRMLLTVPLRFRGLILLPFLAALLPKELYGVWVQILVTRDLLVGLAGLRLETALVRFLEGEEDRRAVAQWVLVLIWVSSLVVFGLLVCFRGALSRLLFDDSRYHAYLIPLGAWVWISASLQIGLAVFRSQLRILALSVREFLSALWLIASVVTAWYFKLGLMQLLLLCVVGDVLVLVWVSFQAGLVVPFWSSFPGREILWKYLRYSAPLNVSFFLFWVTKSLDRFLVVKLLGLETVAIYVIASQFANMAACLLNPINYVLLPQVARSWEKQDEAAVRMYFSRAYGLFFLLGMPCVVGVSLLYETAVVLLAGPGYCANGSVIVMLSLSVVCSSVFMGSLYGFHLLNITYLLPIIYVLSSGMNFALCYALASTWGIRGAALSRLLTFLIAALVMTGWACWRMRVRVPLGIFVKAMGASAGMGIVMYIYPRTTWVDTVISGILGSTVYFILLLGLGIITRDIVLRHAAAILRMLRPASGGALRL